MAVFQRSNSSQWHCEFVLHGIRIRRTTACATKAEAKAFEARLRAELIASPGGSLTASMSLKAGLDRHLGIRRQLSQTVTGICREEDMAKSLLKEFSPTIPLERISGPLINDFVERALGRGSKPNTINRKLAVLKAMLRRAYRDWGCLAKMPIIRQVPLGPTRVRWLTPDEEERLLAACPEHLRRLVVFLHDTGARLGEALRLKWADVDLQKKPRPTVRFNQTKTGRPRTVPLPERTAVMLQGLWQERKPSTGDTVILTAYGEPYGHRQLNCWYRAMAKAGVEDFRIHDLRHSYASRLASRGVPLLGIAKLLGHSSVKMTERYAHLAPSVYDEFVGVLDG